MYSAVIPRAPKRVQSPFPRHNGSPAFHAVSYRRVSGLSCLYREPSPAFEFGRPAIRRLFPAFNFIDRGFDIGNRCQILGPCRPPFHCKKFSKSDHTYCTAFEFDLGGGSEEIFKGPSTVNGAQAVEIAELCFQQNVARTDQMSFIGLEPTWITTRNGMNVH